LCVWYLYAVCMYVCMYFYVYSNSNLLHVQYGVVQYTTIDYYYYRILVKNNALLYNTVLYFTIQSRFPLAEALPAHQTHQCNGARTYDVPKFRRPRGALCRVAQANCTKATY